MPPELFFDRDGGSAADLHRLLFTVADFCKHSIMKVGYEGNTFFTRMSIKVTLKDTDLEIYTYLLFTAQEDGRRTAFFAVVERLPMLATCFARSRTFLRMCALL